MANITPYTNQIRTARYGEEVRGSIVNALEAMNTDINNDTASARSYANAASANATTCQNISDNLQSVIQSVEQTEATIEAAETQRQEAEATRQATETGYVAQCRNYAERAENAVLRYGVTTFNGRPGAVLPADGDYSADMISYGDNGTVSGKFETVDSAIAENADAITENADAIAALDTEIHTIDQGDITIPSGWTSGGSGRNYYYRLGNICMVLLDCTPPERVGGTTIFTLPTACHPVRTSRYSVLPGVSRSSDDGQDHYIIITSDGNINYTGKGRVFNTFTFICNG